MVEKLERKRLPIGERIVLFLDDYFGERDGEPKPETQGERRLRIQNELLNESTGGLSDEPRPWSLRLWR